MDQPISQSKSPALGNTKPVFLGSFEIAIAQGYPSSTAQMGRLSIRAKDGGKELYTVFGEGLGLERASHRALAPSVPQMPQNAKVAAS